MVTRDIISQVFRIVIGTSGGTAFTIEQNGAQFLITAKHLLEDLNYPANSTIKLLSNGAYQPYNVEIRYPTSTTIDIAVMKLNPYHQIAPFYDTPKTTNGLTIGQDVYFLGFPYDYDNLLQTIPLCNSPMPFVKKACMSSIIKLNNDDILLLLDGHNNHGFSGGPVCFGSSESQPMRIAAVISGYRHNRQPIVDGNDNPLQYYWKENTGIINAYSIKHAIDVIENWV